MSPESIIQILTTELDGVVPKSSWGETSLFYNPGKLLPNGVYFCTIKEKNGDNDKSSELDRDSVFRVSIGAGKSNYEKHFGVKPKRPEKGGIVNTEHDFSEASFNKRTFDVVKTKLKALSSYKITDLQELAASNNINIRKDDGKKKIKKELYDELVCRL